MSTWTATKLRDKVLEHLNIKSSANSAEAEDAQVVDELWTGVHAELLKKENISFPVNAIPEYAQPGLVLYLAGEAAPKFGFTGPDRVEAELGKQEGLRKLNEQEEGEDYGTPPLTFF